MAAGRHLGKFQMVISLERVVRSSRVGFSPLFGDAGSNGPTSGWTKSKMAAGKISNDHISGMGYAIHFHELHSSFGGI